MTIIREGVVDESEGRRRGKAVGAFSGRALCFCAWVYGGQKFCGVELCGLVA